MSAGAGNGANGFEFFKIQIDLTQQGLGESRKIRSKRREKEKKNPEHFLPGKTPVRPLRGNCSTRVRLHLTLANDFAPVGRTVQRSRGPVSTRVRVQRELVAFEHDVHVVHVNVETLPARETLVGAVALDRVAPGPGRQPPRVDDARQVSVVRHESERGRTEDVR